ncbi:MAG: hypothetical protein AB1646_25210 [Thermodesulfobacteriota bacterium]
MDDELKIMLASEQNRFDTPPETPVLEEEEEEEEEEESGSGEEDDDEYYDDEASDDDEYDEEASVAPRDRRKEIDSAPIASARNIPRPTTSLMAPPTGKIGSIWVSLVQDAYVPMDVAEIEKANASTESEARLPVMTVIEAILSQRGGRMSLEELTEQTSKHWNRPFPGSPYTKEEFIYTLVSNSDLMRVEQ